jgi:integrase
MIGFVYSYCEKYSNKYYNKILGRLTTWADYTIEKYKLHFKNPFTDVVRKKVITNVETISGREFEKLLAIVTPEGGRVTFEGGKRVYETKNRYRPWLKTAFKLGVLMGGRRDEIVYVRWSNIVWQENKPHHIKIENYKVNRIKGFTKPEEKIYATIPITNELLVYLMELGLEKYKDRHDYILAPEEDAERETIKDVMSKGFSHYWEQLQTGKKLQFKNLRKTFKTSAIHQFGSRAMAFWGGSDMNMELKHYVDQSAVNEAVNSMRVLR